MNPINLFVILIIGAGVGIIAAGSKGSNDSAIESNNFEKEERRKKREKREKREKEMERKRARNREREREREMNNRDRDRERKQKYFDDSDDSDDGKDASGRVYMKRVGSSKDYVKFKFNAGETISTLKQRVLLAHKVSTHKYRITILFNNQDLNGKNAASNYNGEKLLYQIKEK